MATALMNVYRAFVIAGVPEELAGYDNRFAKLEADMAVVKWMLGFVIAVLFAGFGFPIRQGSH